MDSRPLRWERSRWVVGDFVWRASRSSQDLEVKAVLRRALPERERKKALGG
jgi:hypothetical protein